MLEGVIVPTVEFPFTMPFTYHCTAVTGGPVTVGVKFCVSPPDRVTLVGVIVTEVGDVPPPLPGAWAIHPTQTSRADTTMHHKKIAGGNFRKGPSDEQKAIENVGGRKREVYSVTLMLSRSMGHVKFKACFDCPLRSDGSRWSHMSVFDNQARTFVSL